MKIQNKFSKSVSRIYNICPTRATELAQKFNLLLKIFEIGTKVKCLKTQDVGKIIKIYTINNKHFFGVCFKTAKINRHSLHGDCSFGYGEYFKKSELSIVQ